METSVVSAVMPVLDAGRKNMAISPTPTHLRVWRTSMLGVGRWARWSTSPPPMLGSPISLPAASICGSERLMPSISLLPGALMQPSSRSIGAWPPLPGNWVSPSRCRKRAETKTPNWAAVDSELKCPVHIAHDMSASVVDDGPVGLWVTRSVIHKSTGLPRPPSGVKRPRQWSVLPARIGRCIAGRERCSGRRRGAGAL